MTEYRFVIPGPLRAKGRPRLALNRRRAYAYTPRETAEYEERVGYHAKAAGVRPLDGPVEVCVTFYVAGRKDVDNLIKSLFDGLNGVGFNDDRQVVDLTARKRPAKRSEERAEVVLRRAAG